MKVLPLHANNPIAGKLVSFRISNGALAVKDFPTRLKVLNWGISQTIKGPVTVGLDTVASLARNQKATGHDRVAIDFEHQTVPGSEEHDRIVKAKGTIHPLPMAGYGTPLVIPNDGLYLDDIVWTPAGKEFAANYHDLSPTPHLDAKGEVDFLHSVALCQHGAVDGLTFYSASFLTLNQPPTPSSTMDPIRAALIALLQKLGVTLPDTASDADITDAVGAYAAPEKPAPAAPATPATPEKKDAPITPMSADYQSLLARLEKVEVREADAERTSIVSAATAEGKVIPLSAESIKLVPVAQLKEIVAGLPKGVVPLGAPRPTGGGSPIVALSADQQVIRKQLGLTEDVYLKSLQSDSAARTATV